MTLPDDVVRRPLGDDLAGVAELVGDARVVALGENNHHIAEFGALRDRLVRLLVGELGFSVVALESGFAEGHSADAWLGGAPGALDPDAFTFRFGDAPEMRTMLAWLRERGGVRFAGLDVPGSGGSPDPALRRVRLHLAEHSPEDVGLVDAAVEATRPYAAANSGIALGRYTELDAAARDRATAALIRVLLRVDAERFEGHRIARHDALGALRLDEHLREIDALMSAQPPAHSVSSRDAYQAETVHLLRELHGPDARIVLLQHNGHLQRRPLSLLAGAPSAGTYLAETLGDDYRAIALTAVTGTTTAPQLDDAAHHGIDIVTEPLPEPAPDSVEHALAGLDHPELLDLRPARGAAGPTSIRHATAHAAVDVVDAFDGLVCLPTMTPSELA